MSRKADAVAMDALQDFLPEGSFAAVLSYLTQYQVSLTITRSRRSILGDYRRPYKGKGHRITINGDLNKYAFLLTLLHELAHLLAFERYGIRIAPHGKEWKHTFKQLMGEFHTSAIFPADVASAVRKYMEDPAARSCTDDHLVRTLRKYDSPRTGICLIEELAQGDIFQVPGGEQFIVERKLRKRYRCKSLRTGNEYLFSPLYEVKKITKQNA